MPKLSVFVEFYFDILKKQVILVSFSTREGRKLQMKKQTEKCIRYPQRKTTETQLKNSQNLPKVVQRPFFLKVLAKGEFTTLTKC